MINVALTAGDLCRLMNGRFTYEACEAICDLVESCGEAEPFRIGDLAISFSELPAEYASDYDADEQIIIFLDNGNILVAE